MGRRTLKKISPSLDLTFHFREMEELDDGFRVDSLFEKTLPLEVEVGSGKGLFLLTASESNLGHNFLGIEISRRYARFSASRLARVGRKNATMIQGDAICFFDQHLPSESAAAVHVYFPDPWWKKRHHKRRVMSELFIRDICRVLMPNGKLHFWTDVKDYFEATLELVSNLTLFSPPQSVGVPPPTHDLDYRTHFERRMRLRGQEVYRCRFEKP